MKIILISAFLISLNSMANSNIELTNYFKDQINLLNNSVVEAEVPTSPAKQEVDQMWYLNQFMIRLRAPVGFVVTGLTTFLIIPEVEFVWQRATPEGWTNYKL